MASTTIKVGYRPIRVGFCVNPDSLDEVKEAVRLTSILWGGIYNPIIPIEPDIQIAKRLIDLFKVDLLYPLNNSQELTNLVKDYKYLQWPHFQTEFYQQDDRGVKPTLLDVSNIINYYWEKEFKTIKKSNCVLPKWSKTDKLDPVFMVNFGSYPVNPNLLFDYESGFKKGLRAKVIKIPLNGTIQSDLNGRIYPISLTDSKLELTGSGWAWTYHGIYLGDHDNSRDLINFWNLRASAMDLLFLPLKYSNRVKPLIQYHIDQVVKRNVAQKFQTGVAIWYRDNLDESLVKKATDKYIKQGVSRVHCRLSQHDWNGLNIKPFSAGFKSKNVLANIDNPYGRLTLTFQHPESDIEKNRFNSGQNLMATYDPFTLFEYPEYTLSLPYLPDLNEWYGRNVTFDPFEFRVGKGEFGRIVKLHEDTTSLHPLKNSKLIKNVFERAQINSEDSQAGLVTKRLIEQMGGVDSRVFKITGVRKLIESLEVTDSVTYSTAIEIIRDYDQVTKTASFDKHKKLYIQPREKSELSPQEVFDYLIDKNALRIGLEPTCPNCKLTFWIPIKDIVEEIKCEYCGHMFKIGLQLRHRGDWRFRRSGLFGKNNNQEGAIPVILSLMHFLRRGGLDNFIYSTAFNLQSKTTKFNCETDLTILDSTREGTELLIGECKNRQEITDQDIENLKKIKELVDPTGIKTFLLFSKLTSFSKQETKRFKDLKKIGVSPILLTDADLEPYEPYFEYSNKGVKLPDPYATGFEAMARNSEFLYLK